MQFIKFAEHVRRKIYATSAILALVGIFAMRWNVVIGGQLFSKSFLGYTSYKLDLISREGLFVAGGLMILPFIVLFVLIKLLPPWPVEAAQGAAAD